MTMSIKGVLFDLDGTLLDRTASLKAFVKWQAGGMLKNSIQDVQAFCDRFLYLDSNGEVWKDRVYAQLVDEFNIQDWSVSELLRSYELCFCGFSKPVSGSPEALYELSEKGYRLGLVSNGKSPFQERNFNALGLSGLFGAVIVSEAVGCRKPDNNIFELACQSIGTVPKTTVFVGDNPTADIAGAKSCGMFTIYVPGAYGQTCKDADYVCTDYSELVAIIDCLVQ